MEESSKSVSVTRNTITNHCRHARGRLHAVCSQAVPRTSRHSSTCSYPFNTPYLQCLARAAEKGALGQMRRKHLARAALASFALLFPDRVRCKRTFPTVTQPPFRPSSHILTKVGQSSSLFHELECGLRRNNGLHRHRTYMFSTYQDSLSLVEV